MLPIAIFQNTHNDGPGLFDAFANTQGLPLRIHRLYQRDPLPASVDEFSGLCILGSPASVNDDKAEFRALEQLIVQARARRIPVIGHCFGGQILSKALGGTIGPTPHPEIGWSHLQSDATDWFGSNQFPMFQWHFETFSIPADAVRIATGTLCENQAFCVDDIHLGMQFHCEVDGPKVDGWLDKIGCDEIQGSPSPGVLHPGEIRRLNTSLLQISARVAHSIYSRWARAVRR